MKKYIFSAFFVDINYTSSVYEYLDLINGENYARISTTEIDTTKINRNWDFEGKREVMKNISVLNGYLK